MMWRHWTLGAARWAMCSPYRNKEENKIAAAPRAGTRSSGASLSGPHARGQGCEPAGEPSGSGGWRSRRAGWQAHRALPTSCRRRGEQPLHRPRDRPATIDASRADPSPFFRRKTHTAKTHNKQWGATSPVRQDRPQRANPASEDGVPGRGPGLIWWQAWRTVRPLGGQRAQSLWAITRTKSGRGSKEQREREPPAPRSRGGETTYKHSPNTQRLLHGKTGFAAPFATALRSPAQPLAPERHPDKHRPGPIARAFQPARPPFDLRRHATKCIGVEAPRFAVPKSA